MPFNPDDFGSATEVAPDVAPQFSKQRFQESGFNPDDFGVSDEDKEKHAIALLKSGQEAAQAVVAAKERQRQALEAGDQLAHLDAQDEEDIARRALKHQVSGDWRTWGQAIGDAAGATAKYLGEAVMHPIDEAIVPVAQFGIGISGAPLHAVVTGGSQFLAGALENNDEDETSKAVRKFATARTAEQLQAAQHAELSFKNIKRKTMDLAAKVGFGSDENRANAAIKHAQEEAEAASGKMIHGGWVTSVGKAISGDNFEKEYSEEALKARGAEPNKFISESL